MESSFLRLLGCLGSLRSLTIPWASQCKASDLTQLLLFMHDCLRQGPELSFKERGADEGVVRGKPKVPTVPKCQCIDHQVALSHNDDKITMSDLIPGWHSEDYIKQLPGQHPDHTCCKGTWISKWRATQDTKSPSN